MFQVSADPIRVYTDLIQVYSDLIQVRSDLIQVQFWPDYSMPLSIRSDSSIPGPDPSTALSDPTWFQYDLIWFKYMPMNYKPTGRDSSMIRPE